MLKCMTIPKINHEFCCMRWASHVFPNVMNGIQSIFSHGGSHTKKRMETVSFQSHRKCDTYLHKIRNECEYSP